MKRVQVAAAMTRWDGEPYRVAIEAGNHRLLADEPPSTGGTDQGPTPFGLVLAGLGACTAITLRMYAERKGWPLSDVRVQARYVIEDDRPEINRTIRLVGDLDDEQRTHLMDIAERTPVTKALAAGTPIRTTEARDAPS